MFYQNFGENGGGISIFQYETLIINTTFIENFGFASGGGALYISSNVVTIKNSIFIRNVANFGGAIYLNSQPFPTADENRNFSAISNYFYHNLANKGGLFVSDADLFDFLIIFTNCFFFKNAAIFGGAMSFHTELGGNSIILNSTFMNNLAVYGGAVYAFSNNNFLFKNCIFLANAAIKIFKTLNESTFFLIGYTRNQANKNWNFSYFPTELLIDNPIFPIWPSLDALLLTDISQKFHIDLQMGGCFAFDSNNNKTITKSTRNLYKRNLANERGGVGAIMTCNFFDEDSEFLENSSGSMGGVFVTFFESNLSFQKSNFSKNSAKDLYFIFFHIIYSFFKWRGYLWLF